jgi:hypothetical protein
MDAPQPPSEIKLGAEEFRQTGQITDSAPRHVLLNAYYPTVMQLWRQGMRAIVDGVTYDVCGAECDSQRTQVRCELKLTTAGKDLSSGAIASTVINTAGSGYQALIGGVIRNTRGGTDATLQILTVSGSGAVLTYVLNDLGSGFVVENNVPVETIIFGSGFTIDILTVA